MVNASPHLPEEQHLLAPSMSTSRFSPDLLLRDQDRGLELSAANSGGDGRTDMDKVEVLQKMLCLLDSRRHAFYFCAAKPFPVNQTRETLMPPDLAHTHQCVRQDVPVVFAFVDFVPIRQ